MTSEQINSATRRGGPGGTPGGGNQIQSHSLLTPVKSADLKAKASCRRPQKLKNTKNIKTCQNEHLQKNNILQGFRQNGDRIRIQRKKLRISTLVKIDFGYFLKNVRFRDL